MDYDNENSSLILNTENRPVSLHEELQNIVYEIEENLGNRVKSLEEISKTLPLLLDNESSVTTLCSDSYIGIIELCNFHLKTFDSSLGIFTDRMTINDLAYQLISSKTRIPLNDLKTGKLTEDDFPSLINKLVWLQESKVFMARLGSLDFEGLIELVKGYHQVNSFSLLIIDYSMCNTILDEADFQSRMEYLAIELNAHIYIFK